VSVGLDFDAHTSSFTLGRRRCQNVCKKREYRKDIHFLGDMDGVPYMDDARIHAHLHIKEAAAAAAKPLGKSL
jgi:hypothetical protein